MTRPEVESAEAFTSRLLLGAHDYDSALPFILARDAAIRAEALREAADWLASKVADVRVVTLDCRREAIALKAAGKDWKDAFDRECLSSSRCSGFTDAEEHFRALASKEPDDAKL